MRYGNQYSKRFLGIVIAILFVFGFVKGMYTGQQRRNNAQTVETEHLTVTVPGDCELISSEDDEIKISVSKGTVLLQYNAYDTVKGNADEINETNIGDHTVSGFKYKNRYEENEILLNLTEGEHNVLITYTSDSNISINNTDFRSIIKSIEIKE